MSDEKRREALDRAQKALARSETFRRFLDDPDVSAFFAAYEADRINAIVRAAPTDDDIRKNEALLLHAMREFRSYMRNAVNAERTALKTIMKESEPNG